MTDPAPGPTDDGQRSDGAARGPARPAAAPRGAARRTAILEATLRVVGEAGAGAVTHRRVAAAAGLPLAATTYWFRSKEQMLTAALAHAAELDVAQFADRIRASGDGAVSPAEAVEILLSADDLNATRGVVLATYTLLIEASRDPELAAVAERWTRRCAQLFAGVLARAGSAAPDEDTRILFAAADGLTIEELATGAADPALARSRLLRVCRALLDHGAGR